MLGFVSSFIVTHQICFSTELSGPKTIANKSDKSTGAHPTDQDPAHGGMDDVLTALTSLIHGGKKHIQFRSKGML